MNWSVGARDEQGQLKLDLNIEFRYFSVALEVSSIGSAYQLLINLPVEHDIVAMIAHLGFLSLINGANSILDEVDETFSSNLVSNVHLSRYIQEDQPYNIQSMTARFTIAMVKEEYDFPDGGVIDRMYLSVLFILSAYSMVDSRFHDAVCRVAGHRFGLF